jgi:hypothetical protein
MMPTTTTDIEALGSKLNNTFYRNNVKGEGTAQQITPADGLEPPLILTVKLK